MRTTIHRNPLKLTSIAYLLIPILVLSICLVPPVTGAPQKLKQDLFSASFPSESHGWVCGRMGAIAHTADGGTSWSLQKSGTIHTLTSICFVDSENGWVVGDGGTILHTQDGGKSWTSQKSPLPIYLMAVEFINSRKGWIVGESTTILHTVDGGNTWEIQFQDEDFILKSISFCDELNGWVVGEFGYIFHTKDGGVNWEKQGGYFGFSEETGDIVGGTFLFDVVAIDPSTAWIVGIDGHVTKTVDGGTTWKIEGKIIPKTHIYSVASDNRGGVVIAGNSLLMVRSDGGANFRVAETKPPITYGWIYGVAPRGRNGFVAVGKKGWIYLVNGTKAIAYHQAAR